jgi:hypothetical protein
MAVVRLSNVFNEEFRPALELVRIGGPDFR